MKSNHELYCECPGFNGMKEMITHTLLPDIGQMNGSDAGGLIGTVAIDQEISEGLEEGIAIPQ